MIFIIILVVVPSRDTLIGIYSLSDRDHLQHEHHLLIATYLQHLHGACRSHPTPSMTKNKVEGTHFTPSQVLSI